MFKLKSLCIAPMVAFCITLAHAQTQPAAIPSVYDIRSYSAVGDGATLNTKAVQSAIDACTDAGGGTVLITGGNYLTGTLYLKNNVNLHIDAGATLLGSPHVADYTPDARPPTVFVDVTGEKISDCPPPNKRQ